MALDFPDSPSPGSTYSAPNGVLYTWDDTLGVWTASLESPSAPFVILDAGSISGVPAVGNTLTYTQGVAGGGVPPLNYSWSWKDDLGNALQSGGTSYVITPADFGRTVEVELSVTDSATTPVTITGTTSPTATVFRNPFPAATWDPIPGDGLDQIPGLISGVYSGTGTTLTATGCIEVSTDGSNFSQSEGVTSGDTIYARWIVSPACGGAPTGTDLTGTVTDGTFENDYAVTVNRKPFPSLADVSDTNVPLISVTTRSLADPVKGLTTTSYITLGAASTGSNIQVSTDNGVTYSNVPSAPSTGIPVNNGVTIRIRQTVGSTISTDYVAIINIGDSTGETGAVGTYQSVTYTATTTNNASFPNYISAPSYAPNASPEGLSIVDTGSLGSLDGTTSGIWGDGTNLVTGTNMLLSIGAGSFTGSLTPVNGNTVNIAWDPTYIDGLADQSIASGSITDGVYTNTYAFTVEKNPVYNIPADSDSLAAGSTATIPFRIPNNYNSPVPFYYTPGTDTMLNVQVDINGGGLQSLPSSLGTALTLTPGDTVEVYADLGPNPSTVYSITINMGAFSGLWSETSQALPSIAQPTLVAPVDSPPTLLDPGLNSPSGITLVTSAYSAANGAGAQTTSTYEVYEGGYPLLSTNTISGVTEGSLIPWTEVAEPYEITYGNPTMALYFSGPGGSPANTFITSQGNSSVYTSTDAQTWTRQTNVPRSLFFPFSFLNVGGLWLSAGSDGSRGGLIVSSPSILSGPWTTRYSSSVKSPLALAYGNSTFVSIVRGSESSPGSLILSSPNGFTWTSQTVPTSADLTGLAFANGLFVITTTDGEVLTSSDGATWSATSVTPGSSLNGVTYGNSKWLVTGDGGNIYSSPDTVTWTQETSGTTSSLESIATDGTGFVVEVTDNSTVLSSPDGVDWTLGPLPAKSGLLAYGNGIWVGGGVRGGSDAYYNLISTAPFVPIELTISGAQTDGFQIGDIIISNPAGSGPGTIVAIDDTSVSISPAGATWNIGDYIEKDPTGYTALAGSPYSGTTPTPPTDPSVFIPVADLTPSENYFWRAQYATNTPSAITSPWSTWNQFDTNATFSIPAGTPIEGGYFAGQIVGAGSTTGGGLDDLGVIYNLIVAPVTGDGSQEGQYGGSTPATLQYKTTGYDDGGTTMDSNYGSPATTDFADADHPMFNWCVNDTNGPNGGTFDATNTAGTGIGGYNDWYIPATNELAILYFFLKPSPTANNTGSGSNPNSVDPYTPNTPYGPGFPDQTTSTLFQEGGAQAFSAHLYWSATSGPLGSTTSIQQEFSNGFIYDSGKYTGGPYVRAIRRVAA